ncbi:hypothetical protein GE09DRAFT_949341 [Coniochaeta sp. 2T2.1]|nr:hypothetical protein GE09DRAFT_949341 [Coniochaeta sp. 2T2.1]
MVDENDTDTMVHIARDGDVVLVVGQPQRRLRVYSLIAKSASPVLNAMLGPSFGEGQQLAKTGSTEMPLPEDDADAMETILNVIHCRNDEVKKLLSPGELLRVAIACEKYDCFVPLQFAIQTWLSHMSATKSEDLWAWAMAACLFHEQQAFADTTSAVASNHAGSSIDLTREHERVMDATMLLRTAGTLRTGREPRLQR